MAPLLNRAYQEVYLPGSTFKPFTALAAVKEGYADLGTAYACPSEYVHPGDDVGGLLLELVDARTCIRGTSRST